MLRDPPPPQIAAVSQALIFHEVFWSDVARPMQDTNQLNAILNRAVEEEIIANRKAAKIRAQFICLATDLRGGDKGLQGGIKMQNQPVGGSDIPKGNVRYRRNRVATRECAE